MIFKKSFSFTYSLKYHFREIDSCLPVIRKSIDFSVDLLGREETMSLGLFGSAVCGGKNCLFVFIILNIKLFNM